MRKLPGLGAGPGAVFRSVSTLCSVAAICVAGAMALAEDVRAAQVGAEGRAVKIGFVTFLSGGAAGPFGIPARNAAELLIESINAGSMPSPYGAAGIGGARIEAIFVDENSKQKNADYLKLVEKSGVEMVIGYISSGSCKAIAPEAEKARRLTILFDCGTPQIFEDIVTDPLYTFRTSGHATMDNVAAARYLSLTGVDLGRVAGINQNYAWGRDSWRDFSASVAQIRSGSRVVTEQFPKIYAGQYGSEISALLASRADVVHSSFWGGDMEAFLIQGSARGVFGRSKVVLTTGETAMHRLGAQIPDGTILGARGPHGDLAPESELNTWFREAYLDRFGTLPTYPSYKMAQALLGVKTAADRAGSADQDAVISVLRGLEWDGPSGKVSMVLANGHQAIQDTAYGTYRYDRDAGKAMLVDVIRFSADCVNPPAGVKSIDWIKSGFQGAKCK